MIMVREEEHLRALRDLGEHGTHLTFAWDRSERAVGAASDLALDRRVHPQWLYFFPVPDVERARTKISELGGLALPSITTPEGDLVAACDDAQGAAFGLFERRA